MRKENNAEWPESTTLYNKIDGPDGYAFFLWI
jgi:hypothetical protein